MADELDSSDADEAADPYHDVWETRVRFAETDAQGVVFFGEYLTYLDETFAAFLEAIDYPYDQLVAEGWETHVVNVDVDYHGAARFPDDLVCGTYVGAIRNSSLTFEWRCRRGEETLASGTATHVAVDAEGGGSVRVPDSFRDAVVGFQSVAPDPV
ncbi:acyl-CoA thioesterase [Salinirubellus salinus]|uniref:Acyl-CoA thioesterase n=1 Tax=Salinirubellus salinus TaxID=1364945 RepID=A0A9E7R155_9EURY|nr:thioesterase family protein [Salinirubellus salinus]UWM53795.1 acyl-CoA thioesterase [Salinirubellus salinus]